MVAIFGTRALNGLIRGAAMVAVVVPMSLLGACSTPAPAPQPVVYQPAPAPMAPPPPMHVPAARG
jgi:hypothetical protein